VRHAHCPVLTVRRHSPARSGRAAALEPPAYPETLPWRRILVPLDFSPTSLRALDVAVPLAQENDARLFLLNVVEPSVYPAWMEGEVLVGSEETLASSARQEMPRLAQRLVPPPLQVTSLVGHGRAAGVIVETAERNHIDLIVLSTHGHTGLDRLLLGSTAEHVVRQAKCPVFVVRQSRDRNQNAAEKG
jgi:nucleotide-binding universal stress UspA family protein